MSDINTVALTGNLGGNPEVRYTPKGTAVCDLNLAVTEGYGDNKKTHWIGLTLWGKTAETAGEYLQKGRKIAVQGSLDQSSWEDKESGKKQSKTRVKVFSWTFADGKGSGGNPSQQSHSQPPAQAAPQQPAQQPANAPTGNDDDIPF